MNYPPHGRRGANGGKPENAPSQGRRAPLWKKLFRFIEAHTLCEAFGDFASLDSGRDEKFALIANRLLEYFACGQVLLSISNHPLRVWGKDGDASCCKRCASCKLALCNAEAALAGPAAKAETNLPATVRTGGCTARAVISRTIFDGDTPCGYIAAIFTDGTRDFGKPDFDVMDAAGKALGQLSPRS